MIEGLQASQQHRRLVLKALLWITVLGGALFIGLNAGRGLWLLAICEGVFVLFALCVLRIIDRTAQLMLVTIAYLVPFFTLMVLALLLPRTSFTVFAWVQTIPIICYLLLGLRGGFWMSIVFVSLGVIAFSFRFSDEELLLSLMMLANVGISSMAIMLFSHIYERSRLSNEARLIELASTDNLTGLANRMKLTEVLERERSHALRDNKPLSLIMLDVDFLKRINDQFGHDAGDRALCHLARVLSSRLRDTDLLCRLGGEAFAVLLPGAALDQAAELANDLRSHLAASPLEIDSSRQVMTFSAGVAALGEDGQTLDELMQTADRRMYEAKGAGRDQVVAAGQQYPLSAPVPAI